MRWHCFLPHAQSRPTHGNSSILYILKPHHMSQTSHQEINALMSQPSSALTHSPQKPPLKPQKPLVRSQNHRTGQARRDHSGSFDSISLSKQGYPRVHGTGLHPYGSWIFPLSYSQSCRDLCTETHLGATGRDCTSDNYVPCICNVFPLSARPLNEKYLLSLPQSLAILCLDVPYKNALQFIISALFSFNLSSSLWLNENIWGQLTKWGSILAVSTSIGKKRKLQQ